MTVTQTQDGDGSLGPNSNASITQHSTSGANNGILNQSNDLDGTVSKWSNGSQTQGSPTGGLNGHFDQLSTGISTAGGKQVENQNLKVDNGNGGLGDQTPAPGVVSQTQYGPMWRGSPQLSNPNNVYDVDQRSTEQASNATPTQDDRLYGNCDTSGNCTVNELIDQNGTTETNTCSGPTCHTGLFVTTNSDGTHTTTCNGLPSTDSQNVGTCPFPPPPPPPPGNIGGCVLACDILPGTTNFAGAPGP